MRAGARSPACSAGSARSIHSIRRVPMALAVMVVIGVVSVSGVVRPVGRVGASLDPQPPPTSSSSTGSTEASAEGGDIRARARVGPGRHRPTGCRYQPIVQPSDLVTVAGVDHHAHSRTCPERTPDVVLVPVIPPSAEDLLPGAVAEAVGRLASPDPSLRPLRPERWVVVGLPIEVRLSEAQLEPVVVTAAVDGPVPAWITVTAGPTEVRFDGGDPSDRKSITTCSAADALAPYDPALPGPCDHTFRNASSIVDQGAFTARIEVGWQLSYESSDGPGVLAPVLRSSTLPVRVAEIQALVDCMYHC